MRRALAKNSVNLGVIGAPLHSKRFARKRGVSKEQEINAPPDFESAASSAPAFDLSGLRTGTGRMSTPPNTTSLDTIRSEINAMRREAQVRAEEESLRQQRALAAEKAATAAATQAIQNRMAPTPIFKKSIGKADEALSSLLMSSYRHLNKPNDSYYHGKEVEEGLAAVNDTMQKAFFDDVDEVVRPKNKVVTQRYMELVFPHLAEPHARTKRLDALLASVENTHAKQLELLQHVDDGEEGADVTKDAQLSRLVWLNTLEALEEMQIRQMWHFGLLDTEVIEDLTNVDDDDDVEVKDNANTPVTATCLLEERLDALRNIHAAQEITATIRATALSNSPSLDLAPVLQKAKNRQFADITEKELKLLEKYEEHADPVVTQLSSANKPLSDLLSSPMKVTESLLERALNPSNRLLYAVAERDKALRDSLEGLERIKRRSLLDPVFQEAVHFAHEVEEESVDGYVRGRPTAEKLEKMFGKRAHAGKAAAAIRARNHNAARGPMARSKHAADVPYFYNSIRSVVPARASFNLPAPALTKEEKAALRGNRKRMRGPSRYAR